MAASSLRSPLQSVSPTPAENPGPRAAGREDGVPLDDRLGNSPGEVPPEMPESDRRGEQADGNVGVLASLIETTKPRITRLVTMTSGIGFALSIIGRGVPLRDAIFSGVACAIGTALAAAGANAINQFMERDLDAKMPRTVHRPLPEHRVRPAIVLWWGVVLAAAGVGALASFSGLVPAAICLACVFIYTLIYTPMKTRTTLATYVGTLPGALPPLIGWSAAAEMANASGADFASALEPGGLSLFLLMTVWQIPHFFAIAWLYRTDYALGGFKMLAVEDEDGHKTSRAVAVWTALLIPATLAPYWMMGDRLSVVSPIVAGVTGVIFGVLAIRLARSKLRKDARTLFIASVVHLPVLLATFTIDALVKFVI
ncbi:MAG: heme o synthase [Planctomycetota bacterium]|nr:heme o synthase [Planctomycetota bacterium]